MTTDNFFTKWNNKGIDFDGYYGFQCVDLYRQYVKEVLGFAQSPSVVGAKDIWGSYLKDKFDRYFNDPVAIPQKGDIVIWDKNAGGGLGHIGIFSHGDILSFTSFDQNWPIGSVCHFQPHNYTNVQGWLRAKAVQPQPIEFTDQTLIPLKEFGEVELQAVVSMIKDGRRTAKELTDCLNKPELEPIIQKVFLKPNFQNTFAAFFYNLSLYLEGKKAE